MYFKFLDIPIILLTFTKGSHFQIQHQKQNENANISNTPQLIPIQLQNIQQATSTTQILNNPQIQQQQQQGSYLDSAIRSINLQTLPADSNVDSNKNTPTQAVLINKESTAQRQQQQPSQVFYANVGGNIQQVGGIKNGNKSIKLLMNMQQQQQNNEKNGKNKDTEPSNYSALIDVL